MTATSQRYTAAGRVAPSLCDSRYTVCMGFSKSYLISITNIFSVLDWNWPIFKYNLAWYLFLGFTVVSTILWGRLYCGRICAYGALTQTLDAILPARWRIEVPRSIEKRAAMIKFGILAGVIAYYLVTHDLLIYQYTEPFWMFGMGVAYLKVRLKRV